MKGHAIATRFYAEADGGSHSMDFVVVDTGLATFEIAYHGFEKLFGLKLRKGRSICIEVGATVIPDGVCKVPR